MSELVEKKTIGEVEHIVHASGLWDGTGPVEFSDDGETWTRAWSPQDTITHPAYARVTVYRKEVRVPTEVTIRWKEHVPVEREDWAEEWYRNPTRHFGRTARMIAFRQTFRDILGDIQLPDEERTRVQVPPEEAPTRDWAAEIDAAQNLEVLAAVDDAARLARVFTPDAAGTALHRQLRDKRKALTEAEWSPKADARPAPAAPRDHLPPMNRAARRKKGKSRAGR
jgi:hypothetical protein